MENNKDPQIKAILQKEQAPKSPSSQTALA
jgi:hypothetical protein